MGFGLSYIVNKVLPVSFKKSSLLDYAWRTDLDGLLFVRHNEMYFANGTKLMKSANGGTTRTEVKDFAPNVPTMVWKHTTDFEKKYTLVFAGSGNGADVLNTLYRSPDDVTFTPVLADIIKPYNSWSSIAGGQGTALVGFADYVASGDSRVYNSADDGVTWVNSYTALIADVRHFHNITYNKFTNKWHVSSGDSNSAVKWFVSTTSNPTKQSDWVLVAGVMDQRHRTTHFDFIDKDTILYGADGLAPYYAGIYTANINDPLTVKKIMPLNDESTTYYRKGEIVLIGTYSSTPSFVKEGCLYVSIDGGKSFKRDFSFPLADGITVGGVHHIFGSDDKGNVYIRSWGAKDKALLSVFQVTIPQL